MAMANELGAFEDLRGEIAYYTSLKRGYDENEIDQPPEANEVKYERFLSRRKALQAAIDKQFSVITDKASDIIPGFTRMQDSSREVTITRINQFLGPMPIAPEPTTRVYPFR